MEDTGRHSVPFCLLAGDFKGVVELPETGIRVIFVQNFWTG